MSVGEIMLINPKKRKRRSRKSRSVCRPRSYRRNPVPGAGMALALNPRPRRRSISRSGVTDMLLNSAVTGGGVVAGLMVPEKVFKVTGKTKYLVQAGLAVGSTAILSKVVGRKVGRQLGMGFGIALAFQLINDFVLAPKGQQILSQEEAVEIPEIEQGDIIEIPEVPPMGNIEPIDVSGGDEIVMMPEEYELEQDEFEQGGLDDIEPAGELAEDNTGV